MQKEGADLVCTCLVRGKRSRSIPNLKASMEKICPFTLLLSSLSQSKIALSSTPSSPIQPTSHTKKKKKSNFWDCCIGTAGAFAIHFNSFLPRSDSKYIQSLTCQLTLVCGRVLLKKRCCVKKKVSSLRRSPSGHLRGISTCF